MSGPDLGTSAATSSWARWSASAMVGNAGAGRARAAAQDENRVALGDLTNVVVGGGGRFGAADAEKDVDEARKLKSAYEDLEWLKGKLLEEQRRRERAEMELSRLQGIEARAHQLELQLASCRALLSNKPNGSSYVNIPQHLADLEKQAVTNLNKVGEATLAKERAESATWEVSRLEHMVAAVSEESDRLRNDNTMMTKQEPRDGDDVPLKDMLSCLPGMDNVVSELESTIDQLNELITNQHTKLNMMNERLSIEGRETASLERERDQLSLQVAILESKLGHGDYSASGTEVPCMVFTLAVDSEAKPELKKTKEWLQAVEELKGQAGSVKKQPVVIEICDDEETSMWCDDDDKKLILKSNPSSIGEPEGESCQQRGSCEWFFRGNKLMLSSGMKKYMEELCGYVPPEIPFYLYQMNKSNLKSKGKMRLSAKYISKPFLSCLHNGEGYARFEVDGEDRGTVRVNLSADGRASLTSGWASVIEAKDIKVGDICAFHFKIFDGALKLSVHVFHVVRYLVSVR
ncbi:mitotic spindle checkpoint protein MAD1-like isoform X2 [Phragmites australis]|uniref:mitotic spindle checkpoint protein MAD1-like isoform X2 n=1 Tax=Phragmites australis TaxID=29695 RepID=UPI002D77F148|nr:mitotic spindle checkpoint protein MAD1-like isoform X2 [Phragmites australis]